TIYVQAEATESKEVQFLGYSMYCEDVDFNNEQSVGKYLKAPGTTTDRVSVSTLNNGVITVTVPADFGEDGRESNIRFYVAFTDKNDDQYYRPQDRDIWISPYDPNSNQTGLVYTDAWDDGTQWFRYSDSDENASWSTFGKFGEWTEGDSRLMLFALSDAEHLDASYAPSEEQLAALNSDKAAYVIKVRENGVFKTVSDSSVAKISYDKNNNCMWLKINAPGTYRIYNDAILAGHTEYDGLNYVQINVYEQTEFIEFYTDSNCMKRARLTDLNGEESDAAFNRDDGVTIYAKAWTTEEDKTMEIVGYDINFDEHDLNNGDTEYRQLGEDYNDDFFVGKPDKDRIVTINVPGNYYERIRLYVKVGFREYGEDGPLFDEDDNPIYRYEYRDRDIWFWEDTTGLVVNDWIDYYEKDGIIDYSTVNYGWDNGNNYSHYNKSFGMTPGDWRLVHFALNDKSYYPEDYSKYDEDYSPVVNGTFSVQVYDWEEDEWVNDYSDNVTIEYVGNESALNGKLKGLYIVKAENLGRYRILYGGSYVELDVNVPGVAMYRASSMDEVWDGNLVRSDKPATIDDKDNTFIVYANDRYDDRFKKAEITEITANIDDAEYTLDLAKRLWDAPAGVVLPKVTKISNDTYKFVFAEAGLHLNVNAKLYYRNYDENGNVLSEDEVRDEGRGWRIELSQKGLVYTDAWDDGTQWFRYSDSDDAGNKWSTFRKTDRNFTAGDDRMILFGQSFEDYFEADFEPWFVDTLNNEDALGNYYFVKFVNGKYVAASEEEISLEYDGYSKCFRLRTPVEGTFRICHGGMDSYVQIVVNPQTDFLAVYTDAACSKESRIVNWDNEEGPGVYTSEDEVKVYAKAWTDNKDVIGKPEIVGFSAGDWYDANDPELLEKIKALGTVDEGIKLSAADTNGIVTITVPAYYADDRCVHVYVKYVFPDGEDKTRTEYRQHDIYVTSNKKGINVNDWVDYAYDHERDDLNYASVRFGRDENDPDNYARYNKTFGRSVYDVFFVAFGLNPNEGGARVEDYLAYEPITLRSDLSVKYFDEKTSTWIDSSDVELEYRGANAELAPELKGRLWKVTAKKTGHYKIVYKDGSCVYFDVDLPMVGLYDTTDVSKANADTLCVDDLYYLGTDKTYLVKGFANAECDENRFILRAGRDDQWIYWNREDEKWVDEDGKPGSIEDFTAPTVENTTDPLVYKVTPHDSDFDLRLELSYIFKDEMDPEDPDDDREWDEGRDDRWYWFGHSLKGLVCNSDLEVDADWVQTGVINDLSAYEKGSWTMNGYSLVFVFGINKNDTKVKTSSDVTRLAGDDLFTVYKDGETTPTNKATLKYWKNYMYEFLSYEPGDYRIVYNAGKEGENEVVVTVAPRRTYVYEDSELTKEILPWGTSELSVAEAVAGTKTFYVVLLDDSENPWAARDFEIHFFDDLDDYFDEATGFWRTTLYENGVINPLYADKVTVEQIPYIAGECYKFTVTAAAVGNLAISYQISDTFKYGDCRVEEVHDPDGNIVYDEEGHAKTELIYDDEKVEWQVFEFTPATLSEINVTIDDITYTGSAIGAEEIFAKASFSYKDEEETKPISKDGFTIKSIKNNVNVGTATVVFAGGGFEGEVTGTFKIVAGQLIDVLTKAEGCVTAVYSTALKGAKETNTIS
ncbi:MAG: hypothetical protein IKO15_01115, partial [Clostridiales bacterium]|nr:hypothetical protein [Clostridiales bacterium]